MLKVKFYTITDLKSFQKKLKKKSRKVGEILQYCKKN